MNKVAKPTILITGAGGFVGQELVAHFARLGWNVRALVRTPKNYTNTEHVTYRAYDITKRVNDELFDGADYLIHLAYIKYDRKTPNAKEVNIAGAKNLLKASRKHKLKKNIFMSSMSAHEDAVSVYGKQKLAIEALFNTKRDVSIRSGLIIGDGGIVKNMVGFMKSKRLVPLIDGGHQPLQTIAVYDLAKVMQKIIEKDVSGVLTIATPRVYSYREFYQAIAHELGIKVAFVPVPFVALLGAMRAVSLLHLPLSVGEDNLWGLKKLRAADTAADLKRIGVRLDELEAALKKVLV